MVLLNFQISEVLLINFYLLKGREKDFLFIFAIYMYIVMYYLMIAEIPEIICIIFYVIVLMVLGLCY